MNNIKELSSHDLVLAETVDFGQVLRSGYTIHAWAANELRIVNIVDTPAHYDVLYSTVVTKRNDHVAHGKGANVDIALKRALESFLLGYDYDDYYNQRKIQRSLYRRAHKTTSQLDYWILKHLGTMQSKLDSDGKTKVILEGWDSTGRNKNWITLMGSGSDLHNALGSAFKSAPWRAPALKNKPIKVYPIIRNIDKADKDFSGDTEHLPGLTGRKDRIYNHNYQREPFFARYN